MARPALRAPPGRRKALAKAHRLEPGRAELFYEAKNRIPRHF